MDANEIVGNGGSLVAIDERFPTDWACGDQSDLANRPELTRSRFIERSLD
jgi:hypothetical protein